MPFPTPLKIDILHEQDSPSDAPYSFLKRHLNASPLSPLLTPAEIKEHGPFHSITPKAEDPTRKSRLKRAKLATKPNTASRKRDAQRPAFPALSIEIPSLELSDAILMAPEDALVRRPHHPQ